jgi:predicted transposase/invertase (TIGR01784 family)
MPWMLQDAVFKKLSEITEIALMNKDDRKKYDESLRHYRDTLIVMEGQYLEGEQKGRAEGWAEGRAEGEKKGREEGIRTTALKMKQKGLPADLIAEMTGMSIADIETLG